jgi:hypothetical protein
MAVEEPIRLADAELVRAFTSLPDPPVAEISKRLAELSERVGTERLPEKDLPGWVAFLRLAWLWLTAYGRSDLSVVNAFLELRQRASVRRETASRSDETVKKGDTGAGEAPRSLTDSGLNLLRCPRNRFSDVVRLLSDLLTSDSGAYQKFRAMLANVPGLLGVLGGSPAGSSGTAEAPSAALPAASTAKGAPEKELGEALVSLFGKGHARRDAASLLLSLMQQRLSSLLRARLQEPDGVLFLLETAFHYPGLRLFKRSGEGLTVPAGLGLLPPDKRREQLKQGEWHVYHENHPPRSAPAPPADPAGKV